MIGHYLLTLTSRGEAAILTGRMRPGSYDDSTGQCLVGLAAGVRPGMRDLRPKCRPAMIGPEHDLFPVEKRYDALCKRFGTERVNAAIRNRILANIARRTLKDVPEPAHV